MHLSWLITLLLSTSLFGITLDEIITKSLNQSPSLESINARISANKQNIELSNQFKDPELTLTTNSLDSNQAMSQSTLTIKQKLPFLGKRDSLQKVAQAQGGVLNENLSKAKVTLVASIKEQAYTIWELKELYKIIDEYENLTRQNIELYEAYTSTSDNQHMGIMSAQLSLSNLRIQKSTLGAKIATAYAKLSYLAAFKVSDLEIKLSITSLPELAKLQKTLANNHDVALKEQELLIQNANIKVAELNNYPDINLIGGYSHRENFDNYWSVGIGMSLPIYGSQDYKEEESRRLSLSLQSLKEDTKIAVASSFNLFYAQMKSAYEIYHIIQDEALPQIQHMFELSKSSVSTGGDLFKYIDILIQKLKLEQKSITAVATYNRLEAKISQLSGELK